MELLLSYRVCVHTRLRVWGEMAPKPFMLMGFLGDFFFYIVEIVVLFLTFQVTACRASVNRTN